MIVAHLTVTAVAINCCLFGFVTGSRVSASVSGTVTKVPIDVRSRFLIDKHSDLIKKELAQHVYDRIANTTEDLIKNETKGPSFRTKSTTKPSNSKGSKKRLKITTQLPFEGTDISTCGNNVSLSGTTYEIKSPKINGKYPPNADCIWQIFAKDGQSIRIHVISLNIEKTDSSCKFDYLEIKGKRKLCGNLTDLEIVVNSSCAVIVFHSDANNQEEGFFARIFAESPECTRKITVRTHEIITSPNFPNNYPDGTDCWTLVTAGIPDASIMVTFELLQLETDLQCAYDFLEVFDSAVTNNSLGKFCEMPSNDTEVELSMRSSGGVLLFHFHSDQLLSGNGFKAHISLDRERSSSSCNWHILWHNQTIVSPSFPQNYPPNINCHLELEAPSKTQKIVLLFDWLQLEIDANCSSDRLEIWDYDNSSEKPARVLCGRKTQQFKFVSNGHRLKLRFVSDDFAEFAGFISRFTFMGPDQKFDQKFTTTFLRNPQNASVLIGSSHVLYCEPEPKGNSPIRWFKDDQSLTDGVSEDGTSIIIREFTAASAGRYICKFNSWVRDAYLKVKESDCSILFRKRPTDKVLSEGEFIILECHVIGNSVTIQWEKNGQIVTNTSRVQQLQNGYLVLNNAEKNDSGIYICIARVSKDCQSHAAARINVNVRIDVNTICGKPIATESRDVGKIIGGTDATRGAFPWHVMFWDWRRRAFCGGALLNERWVVTAAHCFETGQESSIDIRLGKYDQTMTEEYEISTKIAEVIRHPDFSKDTFDNDLALVRLTHHVSFNSHISPICMTVNRVDVDEYFYGPSRGLRIGQVTGWGQLKENGPLPRFLQQLSVPIVDDSKCRQSTAFKVTSNMFCAGYGQEVVGDACRGDSGGPFVAQYKSRWILLGIVSWGEGCGRSGKFGFYTKINNYLEWINAIIKL